MKMRIFGVVFVLLCIAFYIYLDGIPLAPPGASEESSAPGPLLAPLIIQ